MANWGIGNLASQLYMDLLDLLTARDKDLATAFASLSGVVTPPANSLRLDRTTGLFQDYVPANPQTGDLEAWVTSPIASGAWVTPVYTSGHFVGVGGTWAVVVTDIYFNRYQKDHNNLKFKMSLGTSTISGAPMNLVIQMPAGIHFANVGEYSRMTVLRDNSVIVEGLVYVYDATHLAIRRMDSVAFTGPVDFLIKAEFELS